MNEIVERDTSNTSYKFSLKKVEDNIINSQFMHELDASEKALIFTEPLFQANYDVVKNFTWDQCQNYIKDNIGSFKLSLLKKYSNQKSALLMLKLAPTIFQQIDNYNDAESVIEWVSYLNSNEKHIHSKEIDDILERSSEKILDNIGLMHSSSKAVNRIKEILDIASKNCSQNFLSTFHNILRKINESTKLKDEDKNELYSVCLENLKDAILFARESNIYSSFILGKFHLYQIIKETGKDLSDFSQADLNDIIDNLFQIYFTTMDSFGEKLSDNDKWDVFTALIPYDGTSKREFVINKISDMVESENYESFTKHFATKILESILTSQTTETLSNRNAKLKCVEIIGNLYSTDISKNNELNGYIKASFKDPQQLEDVNKTLLKVLIEKYKSEKTSGDIKRNIFSLVLAEFNEQIDFVIKTRDEFYDCIEIILNQPDEILSLDAFKQFLRGSISNENKRLFYAHINKNFEKYPDSVKDFILKMISDLQSEIVDNGEKEPYIECVRLLAEVVTSSRITDKNSKERCIETLIDLLVSDFGKQKEIESIIDNSFKSGCIEKELREKIFVELVDKASTPIFEDNKYLYEIIQSIYHLYFDEIVNYRNFKKCLDVFLRKQKDIIAASQARNNIVKFLRSDVPTTGNSGNDKKTFLDSIEDQYNSFDENQKSQVFVIIMDVIDLADDELTEQLFDTVVVHFIQDEIEGYDSNESFIIKIAEKDSVYLTNKWFNIILNSVDSSSEHEEILDILKNEILNSKISTKQRKDCYEVIKNSLRFKNNAKELIKFTIDILKHMIE